MGALTLPPRGGVVYVDANAVIYSVEAVHPYRPVLRPLWAAASTGGLSVVSSELLVIEVLTGPLRTGDTVLYDAYTRALFQGDIRLLQVSLPVLKRGAELRAAHNLKTPDAIHAATALTEQCSLFITNDGAFRRVGGLPVAVLSEILAAP